MESENDVISTLNALSIHTGNISNYVFEAWFDTDDENLKSILNWFCTLNEKNIVHPLIYKEFQCLQTNGLVLEGKELEEACKDLENEHQDIFDYNENLLEYPYLKEEEEILLKEQKKQQNINNQQNQLAKNLKKNILGEERTNIKLKANFETVKESCLELASHLDELHKELYEQIIKYSKLINNFSEIQAFVANIPWSSQNHYTTEVSDILKSFIRSNYLDQDVLKFESTIKSVKKLEPGSSQKVRLTDDLDYFKNNFAVLINNYARLEVEEGRLRAELKFLQELTTHAFDIKGFQWMLKEEIENKERKLLAIFDKIEQSSNEVADKLTNEAKANRLTYQFNFNKKKLNYLQSKIIPKFWDILSDQFLSSAIFEKEKKYMETLDKTFTDTVEYVISDLENCQIRTERMLDIIAKWKNYQDLPIERKYPILSSTAKILKKDRNDCEDAVKILTEFKKNQEDLLYIIFKDFSVVHIKTYKNFKKQIEIAKSFITSPATCKIFVVPHELAKVLAEVGKKLEEQHKAVTRSLEIYQNAKSKLENKWFRISRELWLYFLSEPEKVLTVINELKKEIEKK